MNVNPWTELPPSDCEEVHSSMDNDKERALASAPALQPNFWSESVTKEQLAKLQALRRQRLQLKHTSVLSNKKGERKVETHKSSSSMSCSKDHAKTSVNMNANRRSEPLDLDCEESEKANLPRKRPHKLHWGLDTKERWERKGNM